MNNRLVGIMLVAISLIIIIGIVYFVFFYDFASPETVQNQTENTVSPAAVKTNSGAASLPPASGVNDLIAEPGNIDFSEENLKTMAIAFAERFGSYSNHSNYDNIVDLKIFMSAQMQTWADNFIKESRVKSVYSAIYYGLTTKALQAITRSYDESAGVAEILVKTQRRESTGTKSNARSFQQDIIISLVKEKGAWKINGASWQ